MSTDAIGLKNYAVFKVNFEAKKQLSLHRGDNLYYKLNNIDYTIAEFWHYFEKHQIEKVEAIFNYESKVNYLKRIISQINTVSHRNYRWFLGTPTPPEICNEVNFYADLIVKSFQNHLNEIERYHNEKKAKGKLTHRHHAIIYKYKADANYIPNVFNGIEIEKEFGTKRKQAIYTVWNKKGANYLQITAKELETIIPYLEEFPNAQKAAINDLATLN